MTNLPRGLRNFNPGNIRLNPSTTWQGEVKGTDPDFCTFSSFAYGIRALATIVLNYQRKRGLRTVATIINRWAPPNENDTGAYARAVAKAVGVSPDEQIDVEQYAVLRPLVEAIIKHENGRLAPVTASDIDAGLALAGIMPAAVRKPIAKSPTVIGSAIASAGTAGGAVVSQIKDTDIHNLVGAQDTIEQAKEAVSMTMGFWSYAGIAMAVLTVIGIGIVLWSKYDRRKRGIE
jgi:hypothetical protein